MAGLFITMEGLDGSGKTTQIELLRDYLISLGKDVVITREPGGTDISEKIRNVILDNSNIDMSNMTETFLYAAARAQLVDKIIKPALDLGKIVICDRFLDSSLVYQGIARGIGVEKVYNINSYAVSEVFPDITFYLDITPELGLSRKKKQATLDRMESEKISFHEKVHQGYIEIANKYSQRIKLINANDDINKISSNICDMVNNLL